MPAFAASAKPMLWLGHSVRIAVLLVLSQANFVRASYTLNWQNNDTSGDETGFSIERSDAGAAFVPIAAVAPTVTSYQDTSATGAIAYAYRVCAFDTNGSSAYTNIVTNSALLGENSSGSGGPGQATQTSGSVGGQSGGSGDISGSGITSSGVSSLSSGTSVISAGSHLINFSARAFVGTGPQVLVAGFVVAGSAPMQLLVRGDGPALAALDVADALPDPFLSLFDSSSNLIATNAGWSNSIIPGPSSAGVMVEAATLPIFSQVYAFPLIADSPDSAMLVNLPSGGAFTAQVSGIGGTTGIGLIELYDTAMGTSGSNLSNISARAFVGTGSNVAVIGFSVSGTTSETLLLRGIGPALAQYGVSVPLANPQLTLYDSQGDIIASDTGWCNAPQPGSSTVAAVIAPAIAQVMSSVYASALPADSADCAMVVNLPPGVYTVQLSGINGSTGVGLVEAYDVP